MMVWTTVYNSIKKNRSLLICILSLEVIIVALSLLEPYGLVASFVRPMVAVPFILFLPGFLLLRRLKPEGAGIAWTIIFSVGLSIVLIFFIGLLINFLLPLCGVTNPFTETYVLPIVLITVTILGLVDRGGWDTARLRSIPPLILENRSYILFIALLPLLSVLGTIIFNLYENNIINIIILLYAASIIVSSSVRKWSHPELYPFIVWAFSIALLLNRSLVYEYPWGWDIQIEFFLSNLVVTNGYWDINIPIIVNSMLSVTILAPMISMFGGLDLISVYKVIYPLIFSLLPIGLYQLFRSQFDQRIALFACFFFASLFVFHGEMLQVARQQIAELFLLLVLLLVYASELKQTYRLMLSVIFILSIVISHYGLTYITILAALISVILLILIRAIFRYLNSSSGQIHEGSNNGNALVEFLRPLAKVKIGRRNLYVFSALILLTILWYFFSSGSSLYLQIVSLIDSMVEQLFSSGSGAISSGGTTSLSVSFFREITILLYVFTQFSLVIGVIHTIVGRDRYRIQPSYIIISFSMLMILALCLFIPNFANALNSSRFFHIGLVVLAPYVIIGIIEIWNSLRTICSKISRTIRASDTYMTGHFHFAAIILAIFLLFDTGLVYEVAGEPASSIALDPDMDYNRNSDSQYTASKWINSMRVDELIYADGYRREIVSSANSINNLRFLPMEINSIDPGSYIYYGTYNINMDAILVTRKASGQMEDKYVEADERSFDARKTYDSNGAHLYQRY